jgi:hypothetical protein
MIGNTILIAHIGYPTATFKAPMIYNPYFQNAGPIFDPLVPQWSVAPFESDPF